MGVQLLILSEFLSKWVSMRPTGEYCCCFWNIQFFIWAVGIYHLMLEHHKNWQSFRLTNWDRDKTAIFLPTFWNAFSWIKMFEFRLTFHWILFLMVHLTISQYWFRYGSALGRRQVIIATNDGLVYWLIYAFLYFNDLNTWIVTIMIQQMEKLWHSVEDILQTEPSVLPKCCNVLHLYNCRNISG